MTPRERAYRSIKFQKPDRYPVIHTQLKGALLRYGKDLIELYKKYPNDFYDVDTIKIPEPEKQYYRPDGSFYKEEVDDWGCTWLFYQEGIAGQVIKHPISDWKNLKTYQVPKHPLSTQKGLDEAKETFSKMKDKYQLWGSGSNLFERMHYLRGYEALLIDIAEDRKEVYELADLIVDGYNIPLLKSYLDLGAELISFADDWGTQQQLMINPETWRKIFKPRYKKMFDICKQRGALTYVHSDGMILEIIPDFIEIGLDVINPQFSCMDLKKLKEICNHKICIMTDIDRQNILPFGKPDDVRKYVKKVFEILGSPDGGILARGEIGPDVPIENTEAMLSAFYEYGKL